MSNVRKVFSVKGAGVASLFAASGYRDQKSANDLNEDLIPIKRLWERWFVHSTPRGVRFGSVLHALILWSPSHATTADVH